MAKKNTNIEFTNVEFGDLLAAIDFRQVVNKDVSVQYDYDLPKNRFVIRDKDAVSYSAPSKNTICRDYKFTKDYKYNKLPSKSKITIEFPLNNGDCRKVTMDLSTNNPKDVNDVSKSIIPTIEREITRILQNEFTNQVVPLI